MVHKPLRQGEVRVDDGDNHTPCEANGANYVSDTTYAHVHGLFAVVERRCFALRLGRAFGLVQKTTRVDWAALSSPLFYLPRRWQSGAVGLPVSIDESRRCIVRCERSRSAIPF